MVATGVTDINKRVRKGEISRSQFTGVQLTENEPTSWWVSVVKLIHDINGILLSI